MGRHSPHTLAYQFEAHARSSRRDRPFLLFEAQRFSYAQANALVNRCAHAYKARGLRRGDVVALVLDNRPEFLWHFLAAGKLGLVASLINTHNSGAALVHSLRICQPKAIMVGVEHAQAFAAIARELDPGLQSYLVEDASEPALAHVLPALLRFSDLTGDASQVDPDESSKQQLEDLAAYIYTSGTTGLPKAARIRNSRLCMMGHVFGSVAFEFERGDVTYNCLPLYHSSGIGLATAAVISRGATLALGRRFSASRFFDDVRRFDATSFSYIGELCRYLLAQTESASDREHAARVMVGNGLRPDIWLRFVQRFGIEHVREFYGATEGNFASFNLDDTVGSVGKLWRKRVALAKWDETNDDFQRGPNGFLVKCAPGEQGVLVAKIGLGRRFDGYENTNETEKKIVRNAWKNGDAWFNSGDLLRADEKRRLYFIDRLGDTFRWKGENVSTFEVQEQLATFGAALEVNVYGVAVPGTEGRAGMVALALRSEFDADAFKQHVDRVLPKYARPLFVRVQPELALTATFKLKKAELRAEGFDPARVCAPLYVRHPEQDAYVPLDAALFIALNAGKLRL